MAGITLEQAQAKLDFYLQIEENIARGQKVEVDGQALTRANFADIQAAVTVWDRRVRELSERASGRGRMRTVAVRG